MMLRGGYNENVLRSVFAALAILTASLAAQTPFLPVKDVRAGMHGTGRTVFSGSRIDEFQVEILGVLENIGPKESLILARLSGGPLEQTGVMEGMSGSPVYIDGRLVGAVAMAFPFSKEPIAAIRPIEDMVRIATPAAGLAQRADSRAIHLADADLTRAIPGPRPAMAGGAGLIDIATPISFGGFSQATLDAFGPRLRALGLEPRQGIGGGASQPVMGNPADLKPGSMISVQLLAGDFTVDAQGTVTYIDGNRLYAFGHRFLSVGATALPFARAEVITLIPNVNTSFKLSAGREWMGSIQQDRSTAIAGELGKRPPMAPVNIRVSRAGRTVDSYHIQMVEDPLLSPLLLQMALFSAVDFTEHSVGAESLRITGKIDFQNAPAPLRIANVFAADNGAAQQASLGTAIPLAYLMQSGFAGLRLKSVDLEIEVSDRKRELTIDSVTAVRRTVRAGEKVTLHVLLAGDGGAESDRTVEYAVPIGATAGPLYFTVSDALTANVTDFRQVLTATPRTETQMLATVNNLHPNNKAYVRVWRTDAAFQVEGADLGSVPASVALVLDPAQSNQSGITQSRNSRIAEIEIDGGDMVISGAKTIQVEVKD
jgi:hypothetical protein